MRRLNGRFDLSVMKYANRFSEIIKFLVKRKILLSSPNVVDSSRQLPNTRAFFFYGVEIVSLLTKGEQAGNNLMM